MIIKLFSIFNESLDDKKVPFQFSSKFEKYLRRIKSPISDAIFDLELTLQDISLIDVGDESDKISFSTSNKIKEIFDRQADLKKIFSDPSLRDNTSKFYKNNRYNIKIGRFIKKVFVNRFTDSEIENFVNKYKAITEISKTKFKLLEGRDIIDAYNSTRYSYSQGESNSLLNSCMNDQLDKIEFYLGCPVSLLVLIDDNDLIHARALIWKIDEEKYFMDRVYYINDHDYHHFTTYADDRKWYYKIHNKSGSQWKYNTGEWFEIKVKIDIDFDYFNENRSVPYLDTLVYYKNGELMNYRPSYNYYLCIETDGTSDFNG